MRWRGSAFWIFLPLHNSAPERARVSVCPQGSLWVVFICVPSLVLIIPCVREFLSFEIFFHPFITPLLTEVGFPYAYRVLLLVVFICCVYISGIRLRHTLIYIYNSKAMEPGGSMPHSLERERGRLSAWLSLITVELCGGRRVSFAVQIPRTKAYQHRDGKSMPQNPITLSVSQYLTIAFTFLIGPRLNKAPCARARWPLSHETTVLNYKLYISWRNWEASGKTTRNMSNDMWTWGQLSAGKRLL